MNRDESSTAAMKLHERFFGRITTDRNLDRKTGSYRGNEGLLEFRWMKYKEGFSAGLVS